MSMELVYTSAPRGLKAGTRGGFTTVAMTAGMPAVLSERLESLSGYRQVYPLGDPRFDRNPVAFARLKVSAGGRTYDVVSRVSAAPADYTGRSNKLAHHVVLEPGEMPEAGPAWLLRRPGFMETEWTGEPRQLPAGRAVPAGASSPAPCAAWAGACGDAGWAGVMVEAFLLNPDRPFVVVYTDDVDPLALTDEALALLPREQRWRVTFNTYFTDLPAGLTCTWRFCLTGTPAAVEAARTLPPERVLDLASAGPAPATAAADAAREGRLVPGLAPVAPAAVASTGGEAPARRTPMKLKPAAATAPAAGIEPPPVRMEEWPPVAAPVREPPERSRVKWVVTVAAAVAGLVIGVGVTVVLMGGKGPGTQVSIAPPTSMPTSAPAITTEASGPVEPSPTPNPDRPEDETRATNGGVVPPLGSGLGMGDGAAPTPTPEIPNTDPAAPEFKAADDGKGAAPPAMQPTPAPVAQEVLPLPTEMLRGTRAATADYAQFTNPIEIFDLNKYLRDGDAVSIDVKWPISLAKDKTFSVDAAGNEVWLTMRVPGTTSERVIRLYGYKMSEGRLMAVSDSPDSKSFRVASTPERDASLVAAEIHRWAVVYVTIGNRGSLRVQPTVPTGLVSREGQVVALQYSTPPPTQSANLIFGAGRAAVARVLNERTARVVVLCAKEQVKPVKRGDEAAFPQLTYAKDEQGQWLANNDKQIPLPAKIVFDYEVWTDSKNGGRSGLNLAPFMESLGRVKNWSEAAASVERSSLSPTPLELPATVVKQPESKRVEWSNRQKARMEKLQAAWIETAKKTKDELQAILGRVRDQKYHYQIVMPNDAVIAEFEVEFKE